MTVRQGNGGAPFSSTLISSGINGIRLEGDCTFAGTGNLNADGTLPPRIFAGVAAFSGSGSLRANDRYVVGRYDETGEAASFALSGNKPSLTEFEFGLLLDEGSLVNGDVLRFRVYYNGYPLDVYAETGLVGKKLSATDFRNAKVVAPIE